VGTVAADENDGRKMNQRKNTKNAVYFCWMVVLSDGLIIWQSRQMPYGQPKQYSIFG